MSQNNQLEFHWFDNPNESLVFLDKNKSTELISKIRHKYKTNKNIDEKFRDHGFLYQLKDNKPIRIKTLKKILNSLYLDYSEFNRYILGFHGKKLIFKIKFPIKLNKPESAILVAAFMSDGNNQSEHPFYSNVDFLGKKILKNTQSFIPNIPWEIRNDKLRFHSILSRILLKLNVPIGNKVILNPKVPKFIYQNKKYIKEYLTQVFDDEGHAPTKISRKIVLGRSVALDDLSKKFISTLVYKKKIYFNSLSKKIKSIVNNQPPNLLKEEFELLKRFKIKSSLRCRGITKYLDRISADWVVEIAGKENIYKFNKYVGFSHPSKVKQTNLYLKSYKYHKNIKVL